ncbi:MAG: DUF2993 domain-containing protein [Cyanobacteria bacterium P01_D01_bin.36]
MEVVTVVLSSLLLLISPVGIVVDQVAENAIRSQLAGAESLDIRIDNGPSYQLLQGKVDKIRIAGRGISPIEGLRFAVAELETDPIDLEFGSLRNGEVVLDEALQGAVHLVLTEEDVNAFLLSPFVQDRLSQITIDGLAPAQARERARYKIVNPEIDFIEGDRIKVSVLLEDLVQGGGLFVEAETGVSIVSGDRIVLDTPTVTADGQPVPPQLFVPVLDGLTEQLSLQQLEAQGLTARVLNLDMAADSLDLAMWVRVDPSVTSDVATTEPLESSIVE